MPPKIAVALINLVNRTLPSWSSASPSSTGTNDSSFDSSFTLLSYYRSLRTTSTFPASSSSFPASQTTITSPQRPSRPSSTFSASQLSPPAALVSRTQNSSFPSRPSSSPYVPTSRSVAVSTSSLTFTPSQSSHPPKSEPIAGDDEWDSLFAQIDIDGCIQKAEEQRREEQRKKEQEDEMRRKMEEERRKENEENSLRQARQKELLNERSNMELLVRHLKSVTENIKRAVFFEKNTYAVRTSLVRRRVPEQVIEISENGSPSGLPTGKACAIVHKLG